MTSKEEFVSLMQRVKNEYHAIAGYAPDKSVYALINRLRGQEKYVKPEDIVQLVRYMAETRNEPGIGGRATIRLRLIVAARSEKAMMEQKAKDEVAMSGLLKSLGI